jgi:hypothetical protein
MALSLTEATALAGFGINEALLKGQGVGAKTIKALGKAAVKLSPYAAPVARGTVRTGAALARRNPVAAAALGGYGLYRAGALDPVEEAIQMEVDRRLMEPLREVRDIPANIQQATQTPVFRPAVKRKVSKYSRAIKMGMAAVKASKFNGKKGTISNAKTTFAKVNKVANAVNKGKKVSAKGVTGVIKRAVSKYL